MKARKLRDALPAAPRPTLGAAASPRAPLQEIRTLTGHSGAKVTLCKRGDASIVRKASATPAANARLMQQADKQRLLAAHGLAFPAVTAQGTDESGLAYFEMDYVPAVTLASTIATAGSYDRAAVLSAVDRMLWLFRRGADGLLPSDVFTSKIDDVAAACGRHECTLPFLDAIDSARCELQARDWSGIPVSPSHGDLTLENILISPSRGVVFIDCDETFASSYWLDAGKLYQDLRGHWFLRHMLERSSTDALNAVQKVEKLEAVMRAMLEDADAALPARLPQLAALGLFRTLPYARSEATVRFVLGRIRHILNS